MDNNLTLTNLVARYESLSRAGQNAGLDGVLNGNIHVAGKSKEIAFDRFEILEKLNDIEDNTPHAEWHNRPDVLRKFESYIEGKFFENLEFGHQKDALKQFLANNKVVIKIQDKNGNLAITFKPSLMKDEVVTMKAAGKNNNQMITEKVSAIGQLLVSFGLRSGDFSLEKKAVKITLPKSLTNRTSEQEAALGAINEHLKEPKGAGNNKHFFQKQAPHQRGH